MKSLFHLNIISNTETIFQTVKRREIEHDARILGGEDLVEQILREADKRMIRQLGWRDRRNPIDPVIKKLCKEGGIEEKGFGMEGRGERFLRFVPR